MAKTKSKFDGLVKVAPMPDGKPPGKRSDPSWETVTFFLKGETRYEVMMQLVRARKGKQGAPDFSELMQALLEKWLADQPPI